MRNLKYTFRRLSIIVNDLEKKEEFWEAEKFILIAYRNMMHYVKVGFPQMDEEEMKCFGEMKKRAIG